MGWFRANIVFPLQGLFCVSLVFFFLPIPKRVRMQLNPLRAVKDGQLCWRGLTFSAAGLYEMHGRSELPWLSGLLLLTLVLSSLLASGGTLLQTSMTIHADESWPSISGRCSHRRNHRRIGDLLGTGTFQCLV